MTKPENGPPAGRSEDTDPFQALFESNPHPLFLR